MKKFLISDYDGTFFIDDESIKYNIEKNRIFTVGDSFNDLEMLEAFNGFCMKNSEELVKSKITKTCTSVAEVIDKITGGTNE